MFCMYVCYMLFNKYSIDGRTDKRTRPRSLHIDSASLATRAALINRYLTVADYGLAVLCDVDLQRLGWLGSRVVSVLDSGA